MLAELLSQLQERYLGPESGNSRLTAALDLSWSTLDREAQRVAVVLSLFAPTPIPIGMIEQVLQATMEKTISQEWIQQKCRKLVQAYFLQQNSHYEFCVSKPIRLFLQTKLDRLTNSDLLKQSFCQVIANFSKQLSDEPTIDECLAFTPAIPHLEETASNFQAWLINEDLVCPALCLGRFYTAQGILKQALYWYEKSLLEAKKYSRENSLELANDLMKLANNHYAKGNYLESIFLCQKMAEALIKLLSEPNLEQAKY